MTKPEPYTESAEARLGKRAHLRRKLAPMAYVELGQSNGGILLNLSEGGFAVQSALSLTSREFPELRFQVPAHQGWLTARGRIVWLSDSRKEAGIQFTELPGEARREIYKWVSTEGEPEKPTERFPNHSRGNREISKPFAESLHHGAGDALEPPIAHNAPGVAAQRRAAATETTAVAVAEPPAQDFRFTDYSMFAEVPEKEAVWAEPAKRRGRGFAALMVLVIAALFFVLGATVGRETVDQWLTELGWAQSSTPGPKVTPPAPPQQPAAAQTTQEKGATNPETAKANDSENRGTGSAVDSPANSSAAKPAEENKQVAQQATPSEQASGSWVASGNTAAVTSGSDAAAATGRNGIAGSGAKERKVRSVDVLPPVSEVDPNSIATEHSILVSTPRPGSRPFYVNLPGETISASRTIAMSARRTLEIQPTASGGSERVIIGKLRTHSEPFYPSEARAQRLEGSVELRARVGRTGQIIGVTPISGPGLLMSAAATAVREWRYEPTYVGGDPAETLADITIVFRLP